MILKWATHCFTLTLEMFLISHLYENAELVSLHVLFGQSSWISVVERHVNLLAKYM